MPKASKSKPQRSEDRTCSGVMTRLHHKARSQTRRGIYDVAASNIDTITKETIPTPCSKCWIHKIPTDLGTELIPIINSLGLAKSRIFVSIMKNVAPAEAQRCNFLPLIINFLA